MEMESVSSPTTTNSTTNEAGAVPLEMLECGVCLGLLCEPLTTACGHTICRICLVRALQRQAKCPICRAVCHLPAESHAETLALSRLAKRCYPALYEQRLEETRVEKEAMKLLLPIFFYNLPIFPQETLRLHLFEPRYKLMMKRIVDTNRRFAYVPNYTNYRPSVGDIACVAELKEVNFYRDGRSELEAKIVGRYVIVDHYVEEQTGGLHYCRVEELKDDQVPEDKQPEFERVLKQAWETANQLFMERREIKAVVVDRYGELPSMRSPEALSLWLAAVLPQESREEKHNMLVCKDTLARLNTCMTKLTALRSDLSSR